MSDQPRFEPYEQTELFADGGASRHLVEGTVARQADHDGSVPLYTDRQVARLAPAAAPERVTLALLQRGQERFEIWCSVCHGGDGYGRGIVVQRGFPAPPSLHEERLRQAPDTHLYQVMSDGLGKMPPYGPFITPEDRWAIVAYVRALQLSQHAPLDAVSPTARRQLEAESGAAEPQQQQQQETAQP